MNWTTKLKFHKYYFWFQIVMSSYYLLNLSTRNNKILDFIFYKGDDNLVYKHKESTSDIHQLLQYVEKKFSDVLIPAGQLVTQEYLGKGMVHCMYVIMTIIML